MLKTYADIAEAAYTDSLDAAKTLKLAVDAFLAAPTENNLRAARGAWIAARIPYMQTEAYRFGNAIVDDWEGKVNAWPLDEGLIDYVAQAYGSDSPENELYAANVMSPPAIMPSSSCFGARISMEPDPAMAIARRPTSTPRIAPTAIAPAAPNICVP